MAVVNQVNMRTVFLLTAALAMSAVVFGQPKESDYYRIETFAAPEEKELEVSGMTMLSDGRLMIATRLGDIFIVEGADGPMERAQFKLWASGLSHPLGLEEHNGWIYTAQRAELTRMRDTNGDGRADVFETVSDRWEISGNYHEYNFGPVLDRDGYMWVTLNKPFGGEPYGFAHWRGWAFRIHPETGETIPMAAGLRSPAGVDISPQGMVFFTDNQGEWCNASKLSHLEFGSFHGHPHGLPSAKLAGEPFASIPEPRSGVFMKDLHHEIPSFKMPAIWFPYDKMGKSPAGFKWDLSEGKFGPFAGQMFVGDQHHSWIMRVDLEEVDGHWQGAAFRFREGFQSGIIRLCFGPDGTLYVGMSNAGWGSRGNSPWGFQRLRWTGETPFEIQTMRARPDGFELAFTQPVDRAAAAKVENYSGESYTYRLESRYGGPEEDKQPIQVTSAVVSEDGRRVRLILDALRAGYVHELHLANIRSAAGLDLLHPSAYYTLVNVPKRQVARVAPPN
jgi:hypothetical protein